MEKSLGEKRVRTDFNVTGSDTVGMIKNDAAQMINMLEENDDVSAVYHNVEL